jgi:DNA-3-methyladenine glycosylase II
MHAMTGNGLLTEELLAAAVAELARRDASLAAIVARHGQPPLWPREPGFPTLVHLILEQQVSLASARAAMDRLLAARTPLTPAAFLTLDDAELKAIGFSRQKTGYARGLANAVLDGALDLDALAQMEDEDVRTTLKRQKGIGDWTADVYLLMALRRPDAFPAGDLALQLAAQQAFRMDVQPTAPQLVALAERWRPYRAVAARLLWHDYLSALAARRAARTVKY